MYQGFQIFLFRLSLLIFSFFLFESNLTAFESSHLSDSMIVYDIQIKGNEKTKDFIILRELNFKKGDSLHLKDLDSIVKANENYIFNLSLFLEVKINYKIAESLNLYFEIIVKERWFTIPSIYLELADRNINEWWYLHQHQLNRVEYGLMISQYNCRGRDETFAGLLQSGFSQRANLLYDIPFIDKKLTTGLNLNIQFLRNREIAFNTNNKNTLQFFRDDKFIRERFKAAIWLSHRQKIENLHQFEFAFNYNHIDDTILTINRDYLEGQQTKQSFLSISYAFSRNHTDIHFYPTKGYYLLAEFQNNGLALSKVNNMNKLSVEGSVYLPVNKKVFFASGLMAGALFSKNSSFLNSLSLGYSGVFVRSYEYYLIKGKSYALLKNDLKFKLLDKVLSFTKIKAPKFNTIPINLYFKVFADAGYMYDNNLFKTMDLNNKLIYSGGIGFDLVSYYDIVLRVEYGVNAKKEQGIFFHVMKAI